MQANSGLQRLLTIPWVYDLFQEIVGGNESRRKFIRVLVRAKPGDKVVDIGCGPAQLLSWLPDVEYVGFDVSASYIQAAQRKYGARGTFIVGDTKSLWDDPRLQDADIVICSATLHHLGDEEVVHLMAFAHRILRKGGRLCCGEPCWIPNQSALSRWVMARDRGKNIRTEEGYRKLAEQVFQNVKTTVDANPPTRIPNVGVGIECQK